MIKFLDISVSILFVLFLIIFFGNEEYKKDYFLNKLDLVEDTKVKLLNKSVEEDIIDGSKGEINIANSFYSSETCVIDYTKVFDISDEKYKGSFATYTSCDDLSIYIIK